LLHVWSVKIKNIPFFWNEISSLFIRMIMVRMQQSMEAYAYCYFRRQLATAFHKDKTDRYNVFYVRVILSNGFSIKFCSLKFV
jgi:hypothetical protein